jgi:four helix bundle protein
MSGLYRELKVWQRSLELVCEIYRQTQGFPREEMYGLIAQMRRAAVSVCSNIAEGKGRSTDKDFVVFLCHARGSLLELETQVIIAQKLGYLQASAKEDIEKRTAEIGKMLNGLMNSLRAAA